MSNSSGKMLAQANCKALHFATKYYSLLLMRTSGKTLLAKLNCKALQFATRYYSLRHGATDYYTVNCYKACDTSATACYTVRGGEHFWRGKLAKKAGSHYSLLHGDTVYYSLRVLARTC